MTYSSPNMAMTRAKADLTDEVGWLDRKGLPPSGSSVTDPHRVGTLGKYIKNIQCRLFRDGGKFPVIVSAGWHSSIAL